MNASPNAATVLRSPSWNELLQPEHRSVDLGELRRAVRQTQTDLLVVASSRTRGGNAFDAGRRPPEDPASAHSTAAGRVLLTEPTLAPFDFLSYGRETWANHHTHAQQASFRNPKTTLTVTALSWALAFSACTVALIFLFRDFSREGQTIVSTGRMVFREAVELPTLFACFDAPTGANNGKKGLPIGTPMFDYVGAEKLVPNEAPEPLQPANESRTILAVAGGLEECSDVLSVVRSRPVPSKATNACKQCFEIGGWGALSLHDSDSTSVPGSITSTIRLRFTVNQAFQTCVGERSELGVLLDNGHLSALLGFVFDEYELLENSGVIDWNGLDRSIGRETFIVRTLFGNSSDISAGSSGSFNDGRNFIDRVFRLSDVLCHVYFFAGIWYPAEPADISYRYEPHTNMFERTGRGPYLDGVPTFPQTQQVPGQSPAIAISPGGSYIERLSIDQQVSVERSLSIFVTKKDRIRGEYEPSFVAGERRVRVIKVADIVPNTLADLCMSASMKEGELVFDSAVSSTEIGKNQSGGLADGSWVLDFRLKTHHMRETSSRNLISLVRFLADFLGYISMTVGISIYSLFVGPTNVYVYACLQYCLRFSQGGLLSRAHVRHDLVRGLRHAEPWLTELFLFSSLISMSFSAQLTPGDLRYAVRASVAHQLVMLNILMTARLFWTLGRLHARRIR